MVEIRNIILIGRTGNGKSTLGNVLVNEVDWEGNFKKFEEFFTESEFATSETRRTEIKKLLEEKNLGEEERRRLEKRVSELENKVAENTKGFFETLTSLPGRALDNTFNAVIEVGRNCKIM